jgi:LysM repeat protein
VSNTSSGTPANIFFANNVGITGTYNVPGSTVCTVTTSTAHGLTTGNRVWLDFTSGTSTDNTYTVTVTSTVAFTVAVTSATTSGNVTVYGQPLMEIDITNSVPVNVTVPGEGILATDGIFVGVPTNIAATVFYG